MQVLSRLAEKMKRDVDVGLGADFRRFHREKAAASRAMPTLDAAASSRDQSLRKLESLMILALACTWRGVCVQRDHLHLVSAIQELI